MTEKVYTKKDIDAILKDMMKRHARLVKRVDDIDAENQKHIENLLNRIEDLEEDLRRVESNVEWK